MWRIHRYYLKELLVGSATTFVVLFGIVLLAFVARGIDRAQGGDLLDAALIVLLFAADTVHHVLAMALLFATTLTFARAAQEREITAIRAAGIPLHVPLAPALLVAMAFSGAGLWLMHDVVPYAHFAKYRVITDVTRQVFLNMGMSGDKIELSRGVMTWRSKDADNHFHDVVVYLSAGARWVGGEQVMQRTLLTASEAWFEVGADGETLTLELRDLFDPRTDSFVREPDLSFSLRDIAEKGRRWEGDRDITTDQLLAEVDRGVHENPGGARYTVHRRSCFALLPLCFVPIGFLFGLRSRDKGRMAALVPCALPLAVFYASDLIGLELVKRVDVPAIGWLPAAALTLLFLPPVVRMLRS